MRPFFAAIGIVFCLTATSTAVEIPKNTDCIVQVCTHWAWAAYGDTRMRKCERYAPRLNAKCSAKVPQADFDWPPQSPASPTMVQTK